MALETFKFAKIAAQTRDYEFDIFATSKDPTQTLNIS